MTPEEKIKLIRLGNVQTNSLEDKNNFQTYLLEKFDKFDLQSFDMFSNLIILTKEEISTNIHFWKSIYQKFENMDKQLDFHLRTTIRFNMLLSFIEEELKITK